MGEKGDTFEEQGVNNEARPHGIWRGWGSNDDSEEEIWLKQKKRPLSRVQREKGEG